MENLKIHSVVVFENFGRLSLRGFGLRPGLAGAAALIISLAFVPTDVRGDTTVVEVGDSFKGQPAGLGVAFIAPVTMGTNTYTGSIGDTGANRDRTDNLRFNLPAGSMITAGSYTVTGGPPRSVSFWSKAAGGSVGQGGTLNFSAEQVEAINAARSWDVVPYEFQVGPSVARFTYTITFNVSGTGSICPADEEWFAGPTTDFPIDKDFQGNSNCAFHQWAWHTFLALMSPADTSDLNGARVFEKLAYPADLFLPGGPTQGYPGRPAGGGPVYSLNQAGPNDNALFDQNDQLVYYSVFLNQAYWDFVTEPDNLYYELSKLQSPNPGAKFPVGTLELKVSWRVASAGSEVYIENADQSYYVIDANVPTYAVMNNRVVATEGTREVKLAMVGMHVVGVVEGHFEFIWATFEQLDNAPNSASGSNPATEGPFDGTGPWSLYKAGTPSDQTNMFDTSAPSARANITRLDPWGGGDSENTNNIIALNKSVWDQLPPSRQLLKNYFEAGAIWTTGALPLNNAGFEDPAATLKGSFRADNTQAGIANTTMETFTQFQNCFYCHNIGEHTVQVLQRDGTQKATTVGPKSLNLSHFVVNYQAEQQLKEGGN